MTRKSIEVIVNTDGTIKIDAIGFAGADCQKATAFLEKALGETRGRKQKAEYYQGVAVKTAQKVGA